MSRLSLHTLALLVAAPSLVLGTGFGKFDTTLLSKETIAKARDGLLHSAVHRYVAFTSLSTHLLTSS